MWSTFFTLAPLRIDSLFDARFYCRRASFLKKKNHIKKIDVFFLFCVFVIFVCAHFPAFRALASFLAPRGAVARSACKMRTREKATRTTAFLLNGV